MNSNNTSADTGTGAASAKRELACCLEQLPIVNRLDIPQSRLYDALYHCSDIAYLMLLEVFKQKPLNEIPTDIIERLITPLVCYCCLPVCLAFVINSGEVTGQMKKIWNNIQDMMYDLGYIKYIDDELLTNTVNYLCDTCASVWWSPNKSSDP